MNRRIINKAAVYILKVIKYSNYVVVGDPAPVVPNLLIDKAIDYLENKQI